jgi:hypothetical protein
MASALNGNSFCRSGERERDRECEVRRDVMKAKVRKDVPNARDAASLPPSSFMICMNSLHARAARIVSLLALLLHTSVVKSQDLVAGKDGCFPQARKTVRIINLNNG